MEYKCALLVVDNVEKSRFLYEKILGQEIEVDFGENVAFLGGFAIHQKSHFEQLIAGHPVTQKSNNHELYFEDDQLEIIVETLKEHDFSFLHEIIEQPWRQRVVRFYDYDDHIIEIGERMEHVAYRLYKEGKSIEEICRVTYLPEEIVKNAIKESRSLPS
ncbi:MAG: glyoxalase/bleomycin resistance/dioxygenase family protein [Chloroflexi bacterium]|nr:MAG: glyoxalase/bleomycin resistance/dioxygenase family protein [Chloroflexota bacterium]